MRGLTITTILPYCLLLAIIASGCSTNDVDMRLGAGCIIPQLSVDADAVIAEDVNHTLVIDTIPSPEQLTLMLTDVTSGQSYTWPTAAEFSTTTLYRSGTYRLTAFYGDVLKEGFNAPFFYGETEFQIGEDDATVALECKLFNTMLDVGFDDDVTAEFADFAVVVHPADGGYIRYPADETRPVFLRPGDISLGVEFTAGDGHTVRFDAAEITNSSSGYYYHVQVSLQQPSDETTPPALVFSFSERISTDDIIIPLTPSLLEGEAPTVVCSGFEPGSTLYFPEGSTPSTPVTMTASSPALQSAVVTFQGIEILLQNFMSEVDILNMTPEVEQLLRDNGFEFTRTPDGVTVDFTHVIPLIRRRPDNSRITFTLVGISRNGLMSEPTSLSVEPQQVDINLVGAPAYTAGSAEASITVASQSPLTPEYISIERLETSSGEWSRLPDITITEASDTPGHTRITFPVDTASTDDLEIRLLYCGDICSTLTLSCISPEYTVDVDPFALKARIRITPFDPADLEYITRHATVYVDDKRANVLRRIPKEGDIIIAGLEQSTSYDLKLSVINHPDDDDFSPAVEFTTEKAHGLRNGDFEDTEDDFNYKRLACGGRYSQNFVEIYNQQNMADFDVDRPKGWANTNAKTFAKGARRHNTWYMQPSCEIVDDAYSGGFAVKLTTVAWDTDGPAIPNYLQESEPFVPYSRNVPQIAHRAVGKIFLGSYTFDPSDDTETYTESSSISSRPSALNGFYKYVPSPDMPSDHGMALVEVIGSVDGRQMVIARTEVHLQPAVSYTAFTVPLTYEMFGVKAESVHIMLASSFHTGTIDEESRSNITSDNLPDGASRGSTLWLDQLSLSY